MSKRDKDLVEIIKANPGCIAVVDNDCWTLYSKGYANMAGHEDGKQYELADESNVKPLGDGGYGSGHCYGGDILQALAKIVGVKVESA